MTWKKIAIIGAVILVGAAVVGANLYFKRETGVTVNAEAIRARDLEALVSASGKIQPKRQVNVSANTTGRVTRVAVEEGQRVKAGQFLLEIDPRSLDAQLQRGEASVAAAQSSLQQSRASVQQTRALLELARQNLKRTQELWKEQLTTREALERAENDVQVREAELKTREQEIQTNEQRIKVEEAGLATTKYNLNQVIITAPMDGLVTRRSIEEGETAVLGTMNNAGSVLLTIADMSILEAEVEVDETEIPSVSLGQQAKVTIDAVPDRTFKGRVTEVGNSPIQTTSQNTGGQRQATTFKVVITLAEEVPDVRPGFTCTAEITTATRKGVVAVPIQALTVREMLYDPSGTLVREVPQRRRRGSDVVSQTVSASNEPPPGHTRKETEGVFVLSAGKGVFTPVKVGIAGEQYFEVLTGLKAGDQVITGPFASVRELSDGGDVKLQQNNRNRTRSSSSK
ncbi:MAG TPA: efflux RND transporter periplasmic adaptor subunit [Vicinamibacterales bacterium]|jgi:HlyD family secretion protein|nr:efflux RND transporter periplasmic adaptor subunit [Vicinamibacterales bacterium]